MENGCLFALSEMIGHWVMQRINGITIDGVRIGLFIAIFAVLSSVLFHLGHWVFPDIGWLLLARNIWAGVSALGLVLTLFAWLHQ
ncbi:MAG: hypothetical protein ACYDCO_12585 [Armatimonadota bacterium]